MTEPLLLICGEIVCQRTKVKLALIELGHEGDLLSNEETQKLQTEIEQRTGALAGLVFALKSITSPEEFSEAAREMDIDAIELGEFLELLSRE